MLPLALIVAGGANAQWFLPCDFDEPVGAVPNYQVNVKNTGAHYHPDCQSYMEVHCWDGDTAGIASLEHAAVYPPDSIKVAPIQGKTTSSIVEDPDIVVRRVGDVMEALVVFIDDSAGVRRPTLAIFHYYNCGSATLARYWSQISTTYIEATHTDAYSPNIDISQEDTIVVCWENAGSVYGKHVSATTGVPGFNNLVTVATHATNQFSDPDISISATSDSVFVTFIGYTGVANKRLAVREASLTQFKNGNMAAGVTQLGVTAGSGQALSAPRIATPHYDQVATNCPTGTTCGRDYVAVVGRFDGHDWWIEAYNKWGGTQFERSNNANTAVNDDPSGPTLSCDTNWRPVVAWPEGGVVVAWQYEDYDASCASPTGSYPAAPCATSNLPFPPSPPFGPPYNWAYIFVKYLTDSMQYDNSMTGAYSIFEVVDDSNGYYVPSVSEGDSVNGGAVLYNGTQVVYNPGGLRYQREPFGNPNLKWEPKAPPDLQPLGVVFPNPFREHITVRDVPGNLASVVLFDSRGRGIPIDVTAETSGDLRIVPLQEADLPVGLYLVYLKGSDGARSFKATKIAH